jgi:hypothetical protein
MGRSVIGMHRLPCIMSLKGVLVVDCKAVGAYKIRSEKKKRKEKIIDYIMLGVVMCPF